MLSYCRTIVCCGLYLFFTGALFGQPDVHLPPDHPALYSSFCFFAEDFGAEILGRRIEEQTGSRRGDCAPVQRQAPSRNSSWYRSVEASSFDGKLEDAAGAHKRRAPGVR